MRFKPIIFFRKNIKENCLHHYCIAGKFKGLKLIQEAADAFL
jgi:hypothetical protein